MICKQCKKDIRGDCMLTNGICVFCHYKTDAWDSNGELVTKEEAIPKRFVLSVVEEIIQNPDYFGYRGGRIEVHDRDNETGYAIGEARFLIPEEFITGFRELFDFKETDKPIYINFDMPKMLEKK